jgi:hypothetical protein
MPRVGREGPGLPGKRRGGVPCRTGRAEVEFPQLGRRSKHVARLASAENIELLTNHGGCRAGDDGRQIRQRLKDGNTPVEFQRANGRRRRTVLHTTRENPHTAMAGHGGITRRGYPRGLPLLAAIRGVRPKSHGPIGSAPGCDKSVRK